ncbi:MAG TPA: HD domain-containing protein [Nitrospirales bacterium]|nr:HD domain-containing protein [Nitrospirales bacterium]HIB54028.1 HD domain-containing protein [Nitrospirales bacterium]HIC04021.1 HD domain-containing protein [Nitrospirales bacterium]HIN33894.1 HD domain-containing protein [Nitrospirales bacterium]HIO20788.1 HD domain-containing protein [Nitrospirales bacterium]
MADLGKEIVPYHLLNRKGGLTADEFESIKSHPAESGRLLRNMGYHNDAMITFVLSSHEYFMGSCYPDGLKGEEIPFGSRIIAVADAYDALTSWRPYRDPWELHASLDEIRRGVERGFYDPKVVDVLVELMG